MKVIFLKDVPRVGKRHDVKDISDGYATNFLFPNRLAEPATASAIEQLEKRKKNVEIEREIQDDLLMKNLEEIKGKTVTIKGKANEKGSLFKSIQGKEIIEEMNKQHKASISEEFIILKKPIKEIGEHEIQISIKGKKSSFKLVIEATK